MVWFIPHKLNKFYAGFGGLLFLFFLVFLLSSLVVQPVYYTSSPPMFSVINLSLSSSPLLSCREHIVGVGVFFLERVVVVVVKATGRLWGRVLNSFSFHSFGHFYFSLSLPFSSMFKRGACNWVVRFCLGKEGDCCNQGCWLAF